MFSYLCKIFIKISVDFEYFCLLLDVYNYEANSSSVTIASDHAKIPIFHQMQSRNKTRGYKYIFKPIRSWDTKFVLIVIMGKFEHVSEIKRPVSKRTVFPFVIYLDFFVCLLLGTQELATFQ